MDGGATLAGAASPQPLDEQFRISPLGQWMCRTCGAVVEYFDGRQLHAEWHETLHLAVSS